MNGWSNLEGFYKHSSYLGYIRGFPGAGEPPTTGCEQRFLRRGIKIPASHPWPDCAGPRAQNSEPSRTPRPDRHAGKQTQPIRSTTPLACLSTDRPAYLGWHKIGYPRNSRRFYRLQIFKACQLLLSGGNTPTPCMYSTQVNLVKYRIRWVNLK